MSISTSKCGVFSGGYTPGFKASKNSGEWPPNSGHFKRPPKLKKKRKPKKGGAK